MSDRPFAYYPEPDRDDWIDFLHWLGTDCAYDAAAIIRVVEKPYNYVLEYRAYLDAGGVDRR